MNKKDILGQPKKLLTVLYIIYIIVKTLVIYCREFVKGKGNIASSV
jgi:hypothetical protein